MRFSPNIHLMSTSAHWYVYDVNTDSIVTIDEDIFDALKSGTEPEKSLGVQSLISQGYLKENRLQEQEHPVTEYIPYYLNNKLGQMILQITQSCNLRCEYCVYSGTYQNRQHTQKQMSEETAKKAIDFFVSHSSDSPSLALSFYGGEPLLRVEFIQMCIDYCKEVGEGKTFLFNLTTNGTLLNDEVEDFLVRNNISVMFSLDGPESVHDFHRKFAKNGEGSFQTLKRNVLHLQKRYPEYFKKNVQFNSVLDQRNDFNCVNHFVSGEEWLKDSNFMFSTIATEYASEEIVPSDQFIAERDYEYFVILLSMLGKVDKQHVSKLEKSRWNDLVHKMSTNLSRAGKIKTLPCKAHHGGPCIPGVLRTFVTADGYFYPCEHVSETSVLTRIGDIHNGYDLEAVSRIVNIGKQSQELCNDCWAFRYCGACIKAGDGIDHFSKSKLAAACWSNKTYSESVMLDYCVMKDLGVDIEAEGVLL